MTELELLASFDAIRTGLYRHARRPRGQSVSRNYREILAVLLSFAVKYKRAFPSLTTIARMAMVSVRTVLERTRMAPIVRLLGPAATAATHAWAARPLREAGVERRYSLRFPTGLGAMAANVFFSGPTATTAIHLAPK